MAEVVHDEKLLMHFFQDSLSGASLSWYMRLDNTRIHTWKDLVDAFIKQYKYNMDIAPDRTSLSNLEKGDKESIREYAQRWRDLAAQVHPPLLEKEMVALFANTLKAPYYEHVMGSSAQQFTDAVVVAERIEQGVKSGRISTPVEKKSFGVRKREIDHVKSSYRSKKGPFQSWYKPDLTCEYHAGIAGHNIHTCNAFKRKLLQLIKAGWIEFEDAPNVNVNPLPNHVSGSGFVNMLELEHSNILKVSMDKIYQMMVDASYKEGSEKCCELHNIKGHVISHCEGFHKKVMQMISCGLLRIEKATSEEVFMMEASNKEVCRVQFTTGKPPKLVLSKLVVEHKGNYSALPHDYGYSFKSTPQPPVFQAEIGGLTRSGRCFTPEELEKQRKAKGKEKVDITEEINKPFTEEETNEFLKLMKHSEYSIVEQLKKTPSRISLFSLILSSEPHRKALQKVLNEAYVPQDINQETMEHLVGRIQASNYIYFTEDELCPDGTGHNMPLYITVRCKDILIGKVLVDNGSALNVLPRHMLKEMPVDESHMKPSTLVARAYDGSPRPIIGTPRSRSYMWGPQMFLIPLQVMEIHLSYNILLGRPWIHAAGAVTSSLHQCLKYIMNGMLITVKAEETISMIKNVAIPFIETEDCRDGNIHAFEIVNAEWVPEGTVLRKPKIPEMAKMAAKCFLKNGVPFQRNLGIKMPNLIKPNYANQIFGLGYKPKKDDYKQVTQFKREARMARIEGREPEEEELVIPPLQVSFPRAAEVIRSGIIDLHINTLESQEEKQIEEADLEMKDEVLPQLSIHTIDEPPARFFVQRLAEGEVYQNWKMEPAPIVFKK
ncbi:uncharacterized protein [Populus alba]|uniref:uncharacterized protein n=1 Tax=Populus alba TaxID=43335 RepID=UPI003CC798F4